MAIIYSYQTETNVLGTDLLVGTSTEVVNGQEQNVTRNYTIQSIADFFSSSTIIDPVGTDFFIPVFNQGGTKITNSIISQDGVSGSTITVTGHLNVDGNAQVTGITTLLGNSTIGVNSANTLVLNSTISLLGPIRDSLGNLSAGQQVLVSGVNGRTSWSSYQTGLTYKGAWNASTNTPTIVSGVGVVGDFYIVSVAGTTNIDGVADWQIGDWIIFTEAGATDVWQKIDAQSSTFQATDSTFIDFTPTTLQTGTVTLTGDLKNNGTTPTNSKFYRGDGTWAEMANYGVQDVNGTAVGISSGYPLLFTNTGGPNVGISPLAYAGGTNVGHVPSGSSNNADLWLNGQGGWTSPPGGYSKWVLEGDNATTVDIITDGRVDFTGGTGITTVVTAGTPNLLTINNDGVLDVALGTLSASTGNPLTLNLASGVETITPHTFAGNANIGFVPSSAAVSGNEFLRQDGAWVLVPDDGVSTITTATPNQLNLTLPAAPGDGPVNINTVMAGGVIDNNTGLVTSDDVFDYIANNAPGTVILIGVDTSGIPAMQVNGATSATVNSSGTFTLTTTGNVNQVIRGDGTLGVNASDVTSAIPSALTAVTTGTAVVLTPQLAAITGTGTTALATGADIVTYVASLGFVESVTTGDANTVLIGGTAADPTVSAVTAAITGAGTAALATGADIVTYVTTGINNKISNVTNPTSAQDVATKNYVDAATVGGLIYQGGFDGATGKVTSTSDYLDNRGTTIAVTKGWTYTVTNAGTFYTETVEVGDVLIAEVDIASGGGGIGDWTTVQNNIGIASATAVGIGNVVPGSSSTVTSPYTSGTATIDVVDSTASQKGAVIVAGTAGDVTVAYSGGTATISSLGKADQNIYSTIGVSGQTDLVAYSTTSRIDFVNGTGIVMTTATGTPNLLTVTNSDRGSSQNIFKTVAVSGQVDINAGSNTDTLNLAGAGGITITTSGNTLTLNGSGAGYAGWTAGATAGTSDVIDSNDILDFKAAYSNPSGITQSDTYFKTTISTAGTTKTITFAPQIGAAGTATASTLVDRDGSGNIWVTQVNGELNGTINSTTTATTQSVGDNTTKVATTAFVQANAGDVNTVIITVQTVGGNNYFFIDGTQQGDITILPGFTYRLDQSATTPTPGNSGHPLLLSENPNNSPSAPFTTGVTTVGTPGSAGAYTQVILEQDAPKLYYYCQNHSGMGGEINSDAGSMSTWKLDGDSGTEQTVNDGELVQLLGTAGNITTEAKASRTVEVDLATVGSAQTNVPLATVSIDTFGRVTALSPGTTGTYAQDVISVDTTGQAGYLYVFTATLALTLPTGVVGSSIKISNLSNTATCTLVSAAGEKIMAQPSPMTLDTNYAAFELIYTNATNGWVIIGAN